jgi:hypothetical protein
MREVQFIPAAWMELAAQNYPERVILYSRTVQVPDFPDAGQERVSVQPPENCKVPLLPETRYAA